MIKAGYDCIILMRIPIPQKMDLISRQGSITHNMSEILSLTPEQIAVPKGLIDAE